MKTGKFLTIKGRLQILKAHGIAVEVTGNSAIAYKDGKELMKAEYSKDKIAQFRASPPPDYMMDALIKVYLVRNIFAELYRDGLININIHGDWDTIDPPIFMQKFGRSKRPE